MISPTSFWDFQEVRGRRGKIFQTNWVDTPQATSQHYKIHWSPPFQLRVIAIYLLTFKDLNVFLQALNPLLEQQEPQAGSFLSASPDLSLPQTPHN